MYAKERRFATSESSCGTMVTIWLEVVRRVPRKFTFLRENFREKIRNCSNEIVFFTYLLKPLLHLFQRIPTALRLRLNPGIPSDDNSTPTKRAFRLEKQNNFSLKDRLSVHLGKALHKRPKFFPLDFSSVLFSPRFFFPEFCPSDHTSDSITEIAEVDPVSSNFRVFSPLLCCSKTPIEAMHF